MNLAVLSVIGGGIILGLMSYVVYLFRKLKKQKVLIAKHQVLAIEKRNANIFENVQTLCMVGIQGQCDLSELSIRIYCIMDYVQGEHRVDFEQEFPATTELYHTVKDMSRGEERSSLPKKERMTQNLIRMKAEERLHDVIVQELTLLQQLVKPLNSQIPIQVG